MLDKMLQVFSTRMLDDPLHNLYLCSILHGWSEPMGTSKSHPLQGVATDISYTGTGGYQPLGRDDGGGAGSLLLDMEEQS